MQTFLEYSKLNCSNVILSTVSIFELKMARRSYKNLTQCLRWNSIIVGLHNAIVPKLQITQRSL